MCHVRSTVRTTMFLQFTAHHYVLTLAKWIDEKNSQQYQWYTRKAVRCHFQSAVWTMDSSRRKVWPHKYIFHRASLASSNQPSPLHLPIFSSSLSISLTSIHACSSHSFLRSACPNARKVDAHSIHFGIHTLDINDTQPKIKRHSVGRTKYEHIYREIGRHR